MICWEGLIEKDNAVRVIDALVDSLDVTQLGFESTGEAKTGRPVYDVSDLLKLYLYGYLNRIRSSRQLDLACVPNIERTEYDDHVEANRRRIANRKDYYRTRQAIVEHPFGTIKRQWGFISIGFYNGA